MIIKRPTLLEEFLSIHNYENINQKIHPCLPLPKGGKIPLFGKGVRGDFIKKSTSSQSEKNKGSKKYGEAQIQYN